MKASGLYHQSQIIKQPDVLNLYTYLDVEMPQDIYKANWKYYYKKCEASSSLTFPVHTISAIDFNENKVFLENLLSSLQIDIEDIHNCAYQGVHAGCLAGGWFAFYRGIFGIKPRENELIVNPKFSNPFKNVSMNFIYQGHLYHISLSHQKFVIESDHSFEINYQGNIVSSKNGRIEIHKNH
jgi:trehalose/maltose hydrolase-like predicted phosphorylase